MSFSNRHPSHPLATRIIATRNSVDDNVDSNSVANRTCGLKVLSAKTWLSLMSLMLLSPIIPSNRPKRPIFKCCAFYDSGLGLEYKVLWLRLRGAGALSISIDR